MIRIIFALQRRYSVGLLLFIGGLLGVSGCNQPKNGTVTGRVTFKGQPVPDAMVIFMPAAGPAAGAVTKADGTYELTSRVSGDGVVTGSCKIGIYPANMEKPTRPVPNKFHDPETSGLTAEVVPGPNVVDLDLTEK
jgi:hypothetical protein